MVVVLPTPPFWLHIEITRAGAVLGERLRVGEDGIGRPVGPSGRLGVRRLAGCTATAAACRRGGSRACEGELGRLIGLALAGWVQGSWASDHGAASSGRRWTARWPVRNPETAHSSNRPETSLPPLI